jgi:hypothetical protein
MSIGPSALRTASIVPPSEGSVKEKNNRRRRFLGSGSAEVGQTASDITVHVTLSTDDE